MRADSSKIVYFRESDMNVTFEVKSLRNLDLPSPSNSLILLANQQDLIRLAYNGQWPKIGEKRDSTLIMKE